MKIETTETSEQRSLRNSGRSINAVSDELRTNSNNKSNQKLKSGNGNNNENTEQNGSRYNAMSDEEDYDEDEILTTSSEEQDNVSVHCDNIKCTQKPNILKTLENRLNCLFSIVHMNSKVNRFFIVFTDP